MTQARQAQTALSAEAENERRMLAALVSSDDDAEGLIAFALHRKAAMEWRAAFEASRKTSPSPEDYAVFMLGEEMPGRIVSYKERAALMLASQPVEQPEMTPQPQKPPRFRSIFWPWGITSGFQADLADKPVNWRGLFIRLLLLGLAVIVTALFFRFFVPKA